MAGTTETSCHESKRRKLSAESPAIEDVPEPTMDSPPLTMAAMAAHDRYLGLLPDSDSDDDLVSISSVSTLDEAPPAPPATPPAPVEAPLPTTPAPVQCKLDMAFDATPKPVLRGAYEVYYNEVKWSGSWGFSSTAFEQPGQTLSKFSYRCIKCTDATMEMNRPKSGVYEGYFLLQPFQGKPQRVVEKQVTLSFTPLSPTTYEVEGAGKNKYGAFLLRGTFEWGAPLTMEKIYVS
ncbi:hypothetical protein SPRG_11533 [Saprolegnia parasitica CBS 223.65]|uniref:Uncharacterized protein n=1 Tax=Saprolegnia parasitica (strain CBS 223.65) TaxID=695850 RepID=A0A067BY18_SAPPC|nr:hypothetical protein SPRG_11533 [Saprolegnia parasitica CBS 223.65]KDO23439.1 hypothetical protein SPRG_11533 [Saprolegnia parasitica CBS 223.65]|eukprot:XP_012205925.1 hypothetical protein SPRG_11533 [Saprolegnia parasitica CBS 223.65]